MASNKAIKLSRLDIWLFNSPRDLKHYDIKTVFVRTFYVRTFTGAVSKRHFTTIDYFIEEK